MEIINRIFHDYLVLFAMVNAIGNLPVFASETIDMEKDERSHTLKIAVLIGGGIVLAFALFGDIMLRYVFSVSNSAFKIAGGILVFAVAARGVLAIAPTSNTKGTTTTNVAIYPLGFPFLAGPGTILTTILLIQTDGRLFAAITVVLVYLTVLPILFLAPYVEKAVGKVGISVVARILYIFICAKAVSFVLDGFHINL